jgi:hypothetical protein
LQLDNAALVQLLLQPQRLRVNFSEFNAGSITRPTINLRLQFPLAVHQRGDLRLGALELGESQQRLFAPALEV